MVEKPNTPVPAEGEDRGKVRKVGTLSLRTQHCREKPVE